MLLFLNFLGLPLVSVRIGVGIHPGDKLLGSISATTRGRTFVGEPF